MLFESCDCKGRVVASITDTPNRMYPFALWRGAAESSKTELVDEFASFDDAYLEMRRLVREHQRANQPKPRRVTTC